MLTFCFFEDMLKLKDSSSVVLYMKKTDKVLCATRLKTCFLQKRLTDILRIILGLSKIGKDGY